jgi:hypothetical protein
MLLEDGPLFWLALHVDAGKGRWRRHELTELRRCGPIGAHTITCRGRVSMLNLFIVGEIDKSRRKDRVVIYCWYQRSRASQSTKTIDKSQPKCTPRLPYATAAAALFFFLQNCHHRFFCLLLGSFRLLPSFVPFTTTG